MGSMCCVAARPHRSSLGRQDWSLEQNEPLWQTNSSFSPPLSRNWDHYVSGVDNRILFYGSSVSSESKGGRSLVMEESGENQMYSSTDGAMEYFSSSDELELRPPRPQGVNANVGFRELASGPSIAHSVEENSELPCILGCLSSRENVAMSKSIVSTYANFYRRRSFMSKPIHPLVFQDDIEEGDELHGSYNGLLSYLRSLQEPTDLQSPGSIDFGETPERETGQWSGNNSSINLMESTEELKPDSLSYSCYNSSGNIKCGICDRLLSQRSLWSARKIFRSGDMPIAAVLSCWHVYHAECLENTTSKAHKHDPPCPLCKKPDESVEHWPSSTNTLKMVRSLGNDGSSRQWNRSHPRDRVKGAQQVSRRCVMLQSNQTCLKRHLIFMGNSGRDSVEKLKVRSLSKFNEEIIGDKGAAAEYSRTLSADNRNLKLYQDARDYLYDNIYS